MITLLIKRFSRNSANLVTRGALFPLEASAAVLNESKRFMDWDVLQKTVPTKKIQDRLANFFVKEPIAEHFEQGLQGTERAIFSGIKNARDHIKNVRKTQGQRAADLLWFDYTADGVDAFGVNAMTNVAKNMANRFGLALNKAGITSMEDINLMRQRAADIRDEWIKRTRPKSLKDVTPKPQALPPGQIPAQKPSLPKTESAPIFGFNNPDLRAQANGASLFSTKA